jgi:hypothetical protein
MTSVEESRAEVAALAAIVTDIRDTIRFLTAENGGLRHELQTVRKKMGELTRAATTPPPPPVTLTPAPPPRAPYKRKRMGSQSPHQPAKPMRDTSPTRTLMHSKHAGPSISTLSTAPVQPPRTTSEPPRGDAAEGWNKVERKKGKGKSPREKKGGYRSAGGVPTWADIARGGGVSVDVFIGAGAGYTKPNARRPAGKGKKKQPGQQ